jgi:hypothetical protein
MSIEYENTILAVRYRLNTIIVDVSLMDKLEDARSLLLDMMARAVAATKEEE